MRPEARTPTAAHARAPRAAARHRGAQDVRVDTKLNKALWAHGVKAVDRRVRVRLSRKRNDDEDAKEKLYTLVTHVPVESFKGLGVTAVDE